MNCWNQKQGLDRKYQRNQQWFKCILFAALLHKNSRWCEALHDSLRYYMLLSPSWDLGTGWTWGEFPKVYHSQQLGIYVIWLFFCFEYGFAEIKKVISGTLFVLLVYLFCRRRRRKSRSMQNVSLNLTSCNGRWGVFFSHWGLLFPLVLFLRPQASLWSRLSQEHLLVFGDPKKADQCG